MSNISRGTQQPVVNAETISYTPQGGWVFSGNIGGVKENVKALVYQLAAAGYSFRYTCEQSPLANISYETAGDPGGGGTEQPTSVWEYFANRAEIDVLEADLPGTVAGTSNFNAISTAERVAIRAAIQSPVEGQSPAITSASAIDLYGLMLGGVRSYRIFQPVLRRSMLVSNTYAVKASQTYVRRILTSSYLASSESVPTRLFDLPSETTTKTGFVYGFYKNFPNIQQASAGRWQVSQEWEYGLWPISLYGSAINA